MVKIWPNYGQKIFIVKIWSKYGQKYGQKNGQNMVIVYYTF